MPYVYVLLINICFMQMLMFVPSCCWVVGILPCVTVRTMGILPSRKSLPVVVPMILAYPPLGSGTLEGQEFPEDAVQTRLRGWL